MRAQIDVVKSVGNFAYSLRRPIYGLWKGTLGYGDFVTSFTSAVERGFTQAWRDGMTECGLKLDERTEAERFELRTMVNEQYQYIIRLGNDIIQARDRGREALAQAGRQWNSSTRPDKLGRWYDRAELWVSNYGRVQHKAAAMACANKKKRWRLGQTEIHCRSCAGFHGRVYRYSVWEANGALPQARELACHGYRCDCGLEDTDERVTPGPFPASLMGE